MTWLNRWEIEEKVMAFKTHPILRPGAQYLKDYQKAVDSCSDGWSSWMAGTRYASDLSALLEKAHTKIRYRDDPNYKEPTQKDVQKACRKIELFILRNPHLKDRIKPPVLAT